MSPKKKTETQTSKENRVSDVQLAPVDDYPEKNDDVRSAEETALAERRFGPESTEDARNANVPDLTAADVEEALYQDAVSSIDKKTMRTRAEEIEALQSPPPPTSYDDASI